ncbi:MAG: YcaO-like family protein [Mycobacterium kyogaense]|uniref:YcaO-like family protein n=1 Tax=Mycobacterium kyogaense TaxID=2212479 RepID=UPI002FF9FC9C
MKGTLASLERSVDTTVALEEVQRVLRSTGSLDYGVSSARYPNQTWATLSTPAGITVRSHGKGIGMQSLASALFELLEHAVSMGIVTRPVDTPVIPTSQMYLQGAIRPDWLGSLVVDRLTAAEGSLFELINTRTALPIWLPSSLCEERSEWSHDEVLAQTARYWSSNGYAAGMTASDATLHALNEVVERDAFSEFLIAACHYRPVGTQLQVSDHELADLKMRVEASTRSVVELRALPCLIGAVCMACSDRFDYHGRRLVGLGSSGSPAYAVERALLEYEQECAVEEEFEAGALSEDEDDVEDSDTVRCHPFLSRAYFLAELPPYSQPTAYVANGSKQVGDYATAAKALGDRGFPVARRVLFKKPGPAGDASPTVAQVVVVGAEKFHLVRLGLDVEPVGRLRTAETLEACRGPRRGEVVNHMKGQP